MDRYLSSSVSPKIFPGGDIIQPPKYARYHKIFHQEVYKHGGEYLYVEVRASSKGSLTTVGEGSGRLVVEGGRSLSFFPSKKLVELSSSSSSTLLLSLHYSLIPVNPTTWAHS
jgi:hypothetical protein